MKRNLTPKSRRWLTNPKAAYNPHARVTPTDRHINYLSQHSIFQLSELRRMIPVFPTIDDR